MKFPLLASVAALSLASVVAVQAIEKSWRVKEGDRATAASVSGGTIRVDTHESASHKMSTSNETFADVAFLGSDYQRMSTIVSRSEVNGKKFTIRGRMDFNGKTIYRGKGKIKESGYFDLESPPIVKSLNLAAGKTVFVGPVKVVTKPSISSVMSIRSGMNSGGKGDDHPYDSWFTGSGTNTINCAGAVDGTTPRSYAWGTDSLEILFASCNLIGQKGFTGKNSEDYIDSYYRHMGRDGKVILAVGPALYGRPKHKATLMKFKGEHEQKLIVSESKIRKG